jgi:eukaryotic-like serine/threonine-protein kinase
MGAVWIADHLALKTQVAVKFILAGRENDAETRERFSREAEAAAQVKSPHVAQIFDHGVAEDGVPFIVMELLEGEDLSQYVQKHGRLPLKDVSNIVTQVCRALGRAHSKGMIHRDVKPANIFLCDVGTTERFVKLLDFGVAKMTSGDPSTATKSGAVTGTPVYMSPEQLLGAKDLDHRADLWSVAVVAYELMAGRRPFQEETAAAIALRLHTRGMPRASEGMIDLPEKSAALIDAWFARAWALDRMDRFDTALELSEQFDAMVKVLLEESGVESTSRFTLAMQRLSLDRVELTLRDVPGKIVSDVTLQSGRLEVPHSPPVSNAGPKSRDPQSQQLPVPSDAPKTETPISRGLRESNAPVVPVEEPHRTRFLPWVVAFAVAAGLVVFLMRHSDTPAPSPPNVASSSAPIAKEPTPTPAPSVVPTPSVVAPPQPPPIASTSATTTAPATTGKKPVVVAPGKSAAPSATATVKKLEEIE